MIGSPPWNKSALDAQRFPFLIVPCSDDPFLPSLAAVDPVAVQADDEVAETHGKPNSCRTPPGGEMFKAQNHGQSDKPQSAHLHGHGVFCMSGTLVQSLENTEHTHKRHGKGNIKKDR